MLDESPFTRSVIHCYSSNKSVPVSRSQTLEERYIIKNKKRGPILQKLRLKEERTRTSLVVQGLGSAFLCGAPRFHPWSRNQDPT